MDHKNLFFNVLKAGKFRISCCRSGVYEGPLPDLLAVVLTYSHIEGRERARKLSPVSFKGTDPIREESTLLTYSSH